MTQFNAPTYDIERPTGVCTFTGRTLEPDEEYMATLVETDEAQTSEAEQTDGPGGDAELDGRAGNTAAAFGFKRLDVSMEAWQQGHRPDNLFSYWKATVQPKEEKKKLFVDDSVLLNLFRRLAHTDNEQRLAFRFVLGMILMRKRLLKYEGSRREPGPPTDDGGEGQPTEIWLVKQKADDEPMEMINPHLDEARIQQVSEQLGEILEAEL